MRMAFGLVGLLIAAGFIIFMFQMSAKNSLDVKKKVEQQLRPMGATGQREAKESVTLDGLNSGSKFNSLLVRDIVAGGPIEQRYGLKKEDTITALNGLDIRTHNDADTAVEMFFDNYVRGGTVTVIRDGQQMTLPLAGGAPKGKSKGVLGPLEGKI